jgi:hypothetical protein
MTGIIDRQRKPAGTWLTMASSPPHYRQRGVARGDRDTAHRAPC